MSSNWRRRKSKQHRGGFVHELFKLRKRGLGRHRNHQTIRMEKKSQSLVLLRMSKTRVSLWVRGAFEECRASSSLVCRAIAHVGRHLVRLVYRTFVALSVFYLDKHGVNC